jgi:phosphatidylserine/phosphatidylglycerophosphate/cardiolipin synthase-like enzyme
VQIDLCTARNESNEKSIEDDWPFDWTLVATPYPHLKTIVIDEKKVFIGSQNFTQNSLDNNREVGMVIQENPQIVRMVTGLYENDCKR